LYVVLPEKQPKPNWDSGNYYANGYAALVELNALSTGAFSPHDVSGQNRGRLTPSTPFDGCYVCTNENENGVTVDVESELPDIIADFLFQKIVAANTISWTTLRRQEDAENGDGNPEMVPGGSVGERSKRFLGFGIKRLAVPEVEIKEYLTYSFAHQAALQLKFNNWSDDIGYKDDPKNQDVQSVVRDKALMERWLLTDDHICLSLGILSSDRTNKKWKSINAYWETLMPSVKELALQKGDTLWLSEMGKVCEQHFTELYRGTGVKNFYSVKLQAKKDIAREIRQCVEHELFEDWKNGVKSMFDVGNVISALIDFLDERLKGLEDKVLKLRENESQAQQALESNNRAFAAAGPISALMGKKKNLLNAQSEVLQRLYVYRTYVEAWTFSRALFAELLTELNDLKAQADQTTNRINQCIEAFRKERDERCNDGGQPNLKSQLIRFYDATKVKRITHKLILDEKEQRTQTGKVRARLAETVGDDPEFRAFNGRLSPSGFRDALETVCADSAMVAHDDIDIRDRIIGVSIIEKVKERYENDLQGLRLFVEGLVKQAGNYVTFSPQEVQKVGIGIPAGVTTKVTEFTVIIPKAPEHAEFIAKLKDAFQQSKPSHINQVGFVENSDRAKNNEVVLISITNLFPLRYLEPTAFLKGKYDLRISGPDSARARMILHLEQDGTQYPNLEAVLPDKKRFASYVLLGKAMNLFTQIQDSDSGASQIALVAKDKDGFDSDPICLGRTLSSAIDNLDYVQLESIKGAVMAEFTRNWRAAGKQQQLRSSIVAEVEKIKAERAGDLRDTIYQTYLSGGKEAVSLLTTTIE
jgi:hypothetical protein